jgi:hypothetical protein
LELNGSTEAALRMCTGDFMALATNAFANIDGVPVQQLTGYRAASPLFTFGPLPNNNVLQFFGFNAPAGATSLSAADGLYLMLAPLSAGKHSLHYGGTFNTAPTPFTLDITYHLNIG